MKSKVLIMMIITEVVSYSNELKTAETKLKKKLLRESEQLGRVNFELLDTVFVEDKSEDTSKL